MTGTPLDLTPFGGVLTAIGWLLWLIALALVATAWRTPKLLWKRSAAVAIVVSGLYVVIARPILTELSQRRQAQARLNDSMSLFKKRCEGAGEKIARKVENVDGVVWMKWREKYSNADNFADQFKHNDPYGNDCGEEECVSRLLRSTAGLQLDPDKKLSYHAGYRYVESIDPRDSTLYRYTLRLDRPADRDPKWSSSYIAAVLDRESIAKITARYGVTWDDISTREDREHWIAGSSLKVVDLQSDEVIAERIGYMIDRGQGSQAGFRSPWLFAEYTACPAFETSESKSPVKASRSRHFIQRVLRATQGE